MTALLADFQSPDRPTEILTAQPLWGIPLKDQSDFVHRVKSTKARKDLTLMIKVLEHVHTQRESKDFVGVTNRMAQGYCHLKGFSGASLRRKYYALRDAGWNWRSLVKGYKAPSKQPAEFVDFVRGLIEQNHRSVEAALEKLRHEIWPSGVPVPGYGTWQSWHLATHPQRPLPRIFPRLWPDGWSVRNLKRYAPTKAEIKFFQGGLKEAHRHLPVLKRDPSKLRPMEWITIDDFQLDVLCVFKGDPARGFKPGITPAAGLLAKCVGTRKNLAHLLGPMVDRQEKQPDGSIKTIRSGLRADDMQALLYRIFEDNGLPPYPVTIICENATAAISKELELMLTTVFEGRINVQRTSLVRHKTLSNGFVEKGGTPWEKGWIESEFNYLWNQLADMRGYKGSNERLNGPGWLNDQKAYAMRLLGQGKGKLNLPPEVIDELSIPFPSVEQLTSAFDFVLERAENRTKHRLQGFDDVDEFTWPKSLPVPESIDASQPLALAQLSQLTREQQQLLKPETRKESPVERWTRLSVDHPRQGLDARILALFLLTPKRGTWRNHAVSFTHRKVGYSYVDDENIMTAVAEGSPVLVYVDFERANACLVTRENGEPLGSLRALGDATAGTDITDPEAIAEARERRASIVNKILGRVKGRHEDENTQLGVERAHNKTVVDRYQQATADLPAAAKMAAAFGDTVTKAEDDLRDKKRQKTVNTHQHLAKRVATAQSAQSGGDAEWL